MKLLRYIIFIKAIVLLTSVSNHALAFTSFSTFQVVQQTDTTKKDSLKNNLANKGSMPGKAQDTTASEKIQYTAKDSVSFSKDSSIVYLYGKARVIYQGLELDAEYITYNNKTNVIYARGVMDAKGKYVGRPIFKMEGQSTSKADSLKFNTVTKAGNIWGVYTEQEGGFFTGGKAKKQPDDEIHSKGQTYSTCNLPHPHFGIHFTKAIVTENQIIAGPLYLKIEDIPLPLGLPFAFFPKPNKKSSGIILPTPGEDYSRGFFLQDGGYYLGLSDYWDAKITGSIYSYGSYSARLASNYTKRYKFNGNINLDYANNKFGTEGTQDFSRSKDFKINWSHSQNPNAKPGTTFSASVDAGTNTYDRATAAGGTYDPNVIARNTLGSSISYGRVFGNGINMTSALRHSQETATKNVSLTLPDVTLSVPTFNPFSSKNQVGEQKWYQKISVGYSMQATNSISSPDSLLFRRESLSKFRSGVQHNIPINMAFNVLKYFNFNTGVSYLERWHFQTIRKTYAKVPNGADAVFIDTIPGFNRSGQYSASAGLSTKVYSTAQFKKFGNFKALRHVMTPSVNFSYTPDFSDVRKGNYKNALYQNGDTVFTTNYEGQRVPLKYSIHEGSAYGGPGEGRSAVIGFSLDNTVEAKVLSPKDTTGTGERKIPIIQGLGISGSYNLLAKEFKLSTLSFSGRSQFTDKLGINYYGTLDPYLYKDSTNSITGRRQRVLVDKYTWTQGKLPRLTNFGFSFSYSLNPEALKKKNDTEDKLKEQKNAGAITPEQAEALARVSRDPNAFVDFNIPWNFAFSYTFNYSTDRVGENEQITNTLNFNGDANITPKWKVTFSSGWDFKRKTLSQTNFSIYRDLHCWDMAFTWVPFGFYQSYSVDIKVKASILQDLKLSKRKGYYTRF
ncbi:putative LPS assembly protein LptD [Pedobacter nyackensis]|uniref:putative LPS assembly protein LptD n=1 Tax=Pedobacter nyackensis TaxID=475255 RepID=UPI00292DCB53|nr:putative LPS assembly protein LptD [Pedobacter nyackensis]